MPPELLSLKKVPMCGLNAKRLGGWYFFDILLQENNALGPFEDEETHAFYASLPDLRALVPSVLLNKGQETETQVAGAEALPAEEAKQKDVEELTEAVMSTPEQGRILARQCISFFTQKHAYKSWLAILQYWPLFVKRGWGITNTIAGAESGKGQNVSSLKYVAPCSGHWPCVWDRKLKCEQHDSEASGWWHMLILLHISSYTFM